MDLHFVEESFVSVYSCVADSSTLFGFANDLKEASPVCLIASKVSSFQLDFVFKDFPNSNYLSIRITSTTQGIKIDRYFRLQLVNTMKPIA